MPTEVPQFSREHSRLWTATVMLPSWRGFQSRQGGYGTQDQDAPSDGFVKVVFAPEGRGKEPLTDSEMSSARWVIDHEASISSALLSTLLKEYPELQKQYGYIG